MRVIEARSVLEAHLAWRARVVSDAPVHVPNAPFSDRTKATVAKERAALGRCKDCRKRCRARMFYCADCADKRERRFASAAHVAIRNFR